MKINNGLSDEILFFHILIVVAAVSRESEFPRVFSLEPKKNIYIWLETSKKAIQQQQCMCLCSFVCVWLTGAREISFVISSKIINDNLCVSLSQSYSKCIGLCVWAHGGKNYIVLISNRRKINASHKASPRETAQLCSATSRTSLFRI